MGAVRMIKLDALLILWMNSMTAMKLIISAEAPIHELYTGGILNFEFERTESRLLEMRSKSYLAAEHNPEMFIPESVDDSRANHKAGPAFAVRSARLLRR